MNAIFPHAPFAARPQAAHRLVPWCLLLATSGALAQASNCEAISAQISAKVRAGGVQQFTLTTVDTSASAPGRVLGSCERGSKKIMYVATPGAEKGRPAPRNDAILTECKDGTVSVGGNCRK